MSSKLSPGLVLLVATLGACGSGEPSPATPAAPTPSAETPPAEPAPAPDDPVGQIRAFIAKQSIDKGAASWKTRLPMPPKLTFDPARTYSWQLQTSEGPIKIRLLADIAPMHVSSTLYLTELGFYDGLSFHRVIPGFVAQGGDPLGTGRGNPGYRYEGEFSPEARHTRGGLLSMANGGPGTDGSQFFLTFAAKPHLDDKHTIFGEVVEGMDTLGRLEEAGTASGKPTRPLVIEKATFLVE